VDLSPNVVCCPWALFFIPHKTSYLNPLHLL
jgi:hypothetical protein